MYYSDVDIHSILESFRNSPKTIQYINSESVFMWEQLLKKLVREFEIQYISSVEELFNASTGLFKSNIYVLQWYSKLESELETFQKKHSINARVLIRLVDSDDDDSNERRISWLRNHSSDKMVAAFIGWLKDRGASAEHSAIERLLNTFGTDEIKNALDFIALRDDGVVTENAVITFLDKQEENIFQLHEDLLYGRKHQMLVQYEILCEKNPPLKITASLLTQTRRILQAIQAKKAGASAEQLAEIAQMSVNYARRCLETVKNPFFKEGNAVLLFNTLIGLKLEIISSSQKADEILRTSLLRYIVNTGYMMA